jgi:arylsulfatase A-like enzyme/Flp pilus assembly protein TadD
MNPICRTALMLAALLIARATFAVASPNVLLVTLDTTRADHLGCYGDADALTPALDALAAGGTVFDQAYTPSPMTLPSHATIMTGLEPPEHGLHVNGRSVLAPGIPTLAELLAANGYRTGAFVAAFVLNHRFGLDRGFGTYDDDLAGAREQTVEEHLSVYRPGDRVVDAALAWLDGAANAGTPFFAWVHLYDPHYPNYPNDALAGTPFAGVASYDAEVAFMDRQVGRLLEFLDRRGLRDDTLVIALADHGEGLGDHGEQEHGYLLNEEVLRVPFIVSLPGTVRAGHRVGSIVSSVDVLPTVLDLARVAHPSAGRGRSLRAALAGEPIPSVPSYAETDLPFTVFGWSPLRSLTTDAWKFVRTARPELYDRSGDRAERANLEVDRPQTSAALDAELATIERDLRGVAAPADAPVDDDSRRRLEALGYVESAVPSAAGAEATPLRDVKDMLAVKRLGAELATALATGRIGMPRAIEIGRELVRRSPESATFHARLGALLVKADRTDEAATELAEAVRLQPDHAEARSNLGHVLVRQRKFDDAVAQLTEAVRLRPDLAEAHLGLGLAESARGKGPEALAHFQRAADLDPESADAHLNLGNALARQERRVPAAREYRAALELRPDFALAHHNLATLLARGDRLDEALTHAREATRLAPGHAAAQDQLGRLLVEDGRAQEALEPLATAVRLAPETPEFHDDLAAAYAAAGHTDEALAAGREALASAKAAGRPGLARDIGRRLAFYERRASGQSPHGDTPQS